MEGSGSKSHIVDPFHRHVASLCTAVKQKVARGVAGRRLTQLRANRLLRAQLAMRMGTDAYAGYVDTLERRAGRRTASADWAFKRMELMVRCIFHTLEDCGGFKLELFQLELLRAFVIGVAPRQLGNRLHRYKHKLLRLMLVDEPDVVAYDPDAPDPRVKQKIDAMCAIYEKKYTAAIVPRRCGKSTMLEIIMAGAALFLEIDVLIQAHRNPTCLALYNRMEQRVGAMQSAPWFPKDFKITTVRGDLENHEYESAPHAREGKAVFHFLASGANTARGQNPDLVIVDEAAFICMPALLSLIPLMAIDGTKQIHTTSPVDAGAWISRLSELRDVDTGEPHVHMIAQQFKCDYHAQDADITCPCMDVYRPDHMTVDVQLKDILNLISPGAFDYELTGCLQSATRGIDAGGASTFSKDLTTRFIQNVPDVVDQALIASIYVSMDPTFCNGSMSSIGCCTFVRMEESTSGPKLLVVCLDEMRVEDLGQVFHMAHSHLAIKHMAAARALFPSAFHRVPLVFVPERNTYAVDISILAHNVCASAERLLNKEVMIYGDALGQPGLQTVARHKVLSVMNIAACVRQDYIGHLEACVSCGDGLRKAFKRRDKELDSRLVQIDVERWRGGETATVDPLRHLPAPGTASDLQDLSVQDKVAFFKRYGGLDLALEPASDDFAAGNAHLKLLCSQLMEVKIDETTGKAPVVVTGGKKWMKGTGQCARDDLLSAFIIGATVALTEPEHKSRWKTGRAL
ncbi:ORF42 [Ranid herpesvirus 1]|uniref:ORF42 n=1 Tax=Ranid herpesvirus 1 TaxID=85655 RepID=Q14VR6_9VIRU|nr:ORF42 [Ranid herpesvirus 1]ABG25767.1 ORF42 [Ranid herpesvirus 1]